MQSKFCYDNNLLYWLANTSSTLNIAYMWGLWVWVLFPSVLWSILWWVIFEKNSVKLRHKHFGNKLKSHNGVYFEESLLKKMTCYRYKVYIYLRGFTRLRVFSFCFDICRRFFGRGGVTDGAVTWPRWLPSEWTLSSSSSSLLSLELMTSSGSPFPNNVKE